MRNVTVLILISIIALLSVVLFTYKFRLDKLEADAKILDVCETYGKEPKLYETKLPNGNLGFYITCE